MEAFAYTAPTWTETAKHAHQFCCPACNASPREAKQVWVNRRSPVYTEYHRPKWQEFYQCQCDTVWWAWNIDRPPNDANANSEANSEEPIDETR
jgi:hypothetical protein